MWCEGLPRPGWAGSRVRKVGWVVRAGDVPGFSGAAGPCWLMPRRAGDRTAAGRRRPHGGRRPAGPQPVPLAPLARFSLTCAGLLTFWRWIRAQWWKRGVTVHRIHREARIHHDLRAAGNTRVHPAIRAHTGTARGRDKTAAEASGIRQHPHAQAAAAEGPARVMPGAPPGRPKRKKTCKPGILTRCAPCQRGTPQTQVISAPLHIRLNAPSSRSCGLARGPCGLAGGSSDPIGATVIRKGLRPEPPAGRCSGVQAGG
jgi:hypothetical protein